MINVTKLYEQLNNGKWLVLPQAHAALTNNIKQYVIKPTQSPHDSFKVEDHANSNDIGTAVICVDGVLVKGCSEEEQEEFGLCNIDDISTMLDEALDDNTVSEIVMVFNSPGGETTGIEELGRKIAYIDTIKPVWGWTETRACSAAYWLLSQCRAIGMTPSSEVGSVGVYCLIEDITKALETSGVKIEAISSGKFKLMGHGFHTLTDDERGIIQNDVTDTHNKFKNAVKSKRTIKDEDMEGLTYNGDTALANGYADYVGDEFTDYLTTVQGVETQYE